MSVSYHGIRLKSPRSFRIAQPACAFALALGLIMGVGGCTYVCHTYQVLPPDGGEYFVSPVGSIGDFEVFADVDRWRGPSRPYPGRGSWPHWPASRDDVYRIDVSPSAQDSIAWEGVVIEIATATVTFGDSTLLVGWEEVEDARADTLRGQESYLQYRRTFAPLRFVSKPFRLPIPVPDAFLITFDMRVLETATEKVLYRQSFRLRAVVEKHRRWSLTDAFES